MHGKFHGLFPGDEHRKKFKTRDGPTAHPSIAAQLCCASVSASVGRLGQAAQVAGGRYDDRSRCHRQVYARSVGGPHTGRIERLFSTHISVPRAISAHHRDCVAPGWRGQQRTLERRPSGAGMKNQGSEDVDNGGSDGARTRDLRRDRPAL
jgi:hypothetical protein